MVQLGKDHPPPRPEPTNRVLVFFALEGSDEERALIQDKFAATAELLLRDLILVHLGPERVPSTHVRIVGQRRNFLGLWKA